MRRLSGFQMKALAMVMAIGVSARVDAQTNTAPVEREVIISIPDRQLALVQDRKVMRTYIVAVGAEESPSPEGDFRVTNRVENPTYYHPGKVIGPGKQNPLGTRWIGLSKASFGIHGTNQPRSIGKAASHGCIRMKQQDLEELFTMLRVGDKVSIRGERDEQIAAIFHSQPQQNATQVAQIIDQSSAASGAPAQ
jgi:lipoprotein-anchoring transpeptidase ErfK/SrfK